MTDTEYGTTAAGKPTTRTPVPVVALLAFTVAGFTAIMTENVPSGLLPQISTGLGVSEGFAGQLLTAYAVGSVVAAVPVIAATRGVRRRPLLLAAVAGLLVFNLVTALSPDYVLTLASRFVAGMAAGVVWGLLAGYARRMVRPEVQGRAVAIVGVGQPIALSLGVPLGAWLGALFDWRGVFLIMSVVALVLMVWIRVSVPDFPGEPPARRTPLREVFRLPGVRPVLGVIALWILAHNVLYTYVAPFLAERGMGADVPLVLLIFGVASVAGIAVAGAFVDRWLRLLALGSLALFAVAVVVLGLGGEVTVATYLGTALWGFTFGGAPTLLQTAVADAAGDATDVAQSMLVTVFNAAVAGGGVVGGVLLESAGAGVLPWVLLALALLALLVVGAARSHGFPARRRVTA